MTTREIAIKAANEHEFANALRAHARKVVVVCYGASWCKHCERARDAASASAEANGDGRVVFVDADVDDLPFTARRIRWTPTLAVYRKGRLVDELIKARPTAASDAVWLWATADPDDDVKENGRETRESS